MEQQFRYLSTFTGIGGFEVGIHNAYRKTHGGGESHTSSSVESGQGLLPSEGQAPGSPDRRPGTSTANPINDGPLCVGYSEIDKPAISVYEKHFPGVKNYGDITKIDTWTLPDFDCLVWGFPCQAFSIAGKRKWFEDTRGTLFFELARILQAKQPRLFVFENVKGLLSHDNGKTFSTIIATIDELGYDCQWQVLNSKNHWVPQNRERVYIVGHLRGSSRPKVFPFWVGTSDSDEGSWKMKNSATIDTKWWNNARGTFVRVPEATKQWYAVAGGGDSINLSQPNSKTRRGRVWKWVAQTLDTQMQQFTLEWSRIRRLTPVECERLQWFPDNWTDSVSDTQRYKCCGNAVTTNVVRDIFLSIL